MKILIIGNSFGQDSARYLYGIARAAGKDITVVNLHIGGCSLYRHYRNMLSGEAAYEYEINGMKTGLHVSLKQMLLLDEWDWVVTQQCSPKSGEYDTYQPYLNALAEYIHKLCPPAKLALQMTWTFADGCSRFGMTPFRNRQEMLPALIAAYRRAAKDVNADLLLPTGIAMDRLYQVKGPDMYRDGFHSAKGFTRYMIGCLWFMAFTGKSAEGSTFRDLDEAADEETLALCRRIARETLEEEGISVK